MNKLSVVSLCSLNLEPFAVPFTNTTQGRRTGMQSSSMKRADRAVVGLWFEKKNCIGGIMGLEVWNDRVCERVWEEMVGRTGDIHSLTT